MLSYLVKNGSERVVTSAREHIYDLRSLENYTFVDENGKDQGVNVRHKVRDLIEFIQDDDRLREERKKAKKNKDKYIGMSSDAMGGTGMRSNFEDYRNREGFGASRDPEEKGCEFLRSRKFCAIVDFACFRQTRIKLNTIIIMARKEKTQTPSQVETIVMRSKLKQQ